MGQLNALAKSCRTERVWLVTIPAQYLRTVLYEGPLFFSIVLYEVQLRSSIIRSSQEDRILARLDCCESWCAGKAAPPSVVTGAAPGFEGTLVFDVIGF